MTTFGRRGGEGPTLGKKKRTYTATAPDGTKLRLGSYFIDGDKVFMAMYKVADVWYAHGVEVEGGPKFADDRYGNWQPAERVLG